MVFFNAEAQRPQRSAEGKTKSRQRVKPEGGFFAAYLCDLCVSALKLNRTRLYCIVSD